MDSLTREIQGDALNSDVSVADLMRKALLAAKKLNQQEIQNWIELELNGYPRPTKLGSGHEKKPTGVVLQDYWKELPEYRWVPGAWKFYVHMEGHWIITKPHSELAKLLGSVDIWV